MLGPMHEPQSFQSLRKKNERDLVVFYWPFKNGLPFNQTASNIFKMQIYGDVLLVQQAREPCFLPRERYINYNLTTYTEQFVNKRARRVEPTPVAIESGEYGVLKDEMQAALNAVEQSVSADAERPADLAMAAVLPPAIGRQLAGLVDPSGEERKRQKLAALEQRMTAPLVPVQS